MSAKSGHGAPVLYDGGLSRVTSSVASERVTWSQVYLGVGLTTLATLVLELSLTRIFSVVFYYHFAFLAISIALFGLGVGGVVSYLVGGNGVIVFRRLGYLAIGVSVATALALVLLLTRTELTNWTLALIYFSTAAPFILAGAIVSLAISETIERVERVYFFDLIGAAGGCLLLVPFLNFFGGPNTVLVASIFFAASASIWFSLAGSFRGRIIAVGLGLFLVAVVATNWQLKFLDVTFAKGQRLADEVFVKWNSFSRIAVAPDKATGKMVIFIDADATTWIPNYDFNNLKQQDRRELASEGPGFPYQLRPGAKTLIIGPGGGWDVSRALAAGSKDVIGVEINPLIADTIMQKQYPQWSGYLYSRPEVRIVVEDGRSFVRRTDEKFQVLQATLVDTWASTAAGAFALSENNLYTSDAFYDYLSHLTDDGLLAFTRWGFDPPRESLRLLSLAKVALDRLGEHEHWRHVMVIREGGAKELTGWGARDTVVISRKPFTARDMAKAREAVAGTAMRVIYLPDEPGSNPFAQLLTASNPEEFYENYRYDVRPVNDDRPFFFYTVQPRDIVDFLKGPRESADYKINRAVPLLFSVVAISVVATAIILLLPPILLGSRLPREEGVLRFLPYFICIGAGYILIQVALIQKFVILLGRPTYALTVIIFSMLVSSGLGSYVSRKLLAGSDRRLMRILAVVTGLVVALAFMAPLITEWGMAWPLPLKCLVITILIAPVGFAMGMPFPAGLTRLERRHPASVRWAWALNAASSVLGSASAIFLGIYLGLKSTLLIGGLLYLLAIAIIKTTQSKTANSL